MQIIKPYGRTRTEISEGQHKRHFVQNEKLSIDVDVIKFATKNPEVVIAQWISLIDKVGRKPKLAAGGKSRKPNKSIFEFREKMGAACWDHLYTQLFSDLPAEKIGALSALWRRKLHPYGEDIDEASKDPLRGGWYEAFCGELKPFKINFNNVPVVFHKHLYESARPKHPKGKTKPLGLIVHRAQTIQKSVLKEKPHMVGQAQAWAWASADETRLSQIAGNIPDLIAKTAVDSKGKSRAVHFSDVGKVFFALYPKVFEGDFADEPLTVEEAEDTDPGL